MTTIKKTALGVLLAERRTQRGISMSELARRAGVDKRTVSLLERSVIDEPHVATIRALAEALELPLSEVYAAADWLPEDPLPELRPYMRTKYSDLTDSELALVEDLVSVLSRGHQGPVRGDDE